MNKGINDGGDIPRENLEVFFVFFQTVIVALLNIFNIKNL